MKIEIISLNLYRGKLEDSSRKLKNKDKKDLHDVQKLLKKINKDEFELSKENISIILEALNIELNVAKEYSFNKSRIREIEEAINKYVN